MPTRLGRSVPQRQAVPAISGVCRRQRLQYRPSDPPLGERLARSEPDMRIARKRIGLLELVGSRVHAGRWLGGQVLAQRRHAVYLSVVGDTQSPAPWVFRCTGPGTGTRAEFRTHRSRAGRVSDSASLRGCRRARLVGQLGALNPIAACALGSVHRLIRGVNQPVHVGAVIRIRGNPDREGDPTQD